MYASVPTKIWRTLGPVVIHFAIYFVVIYLAALIFAKSGSPLSLDAYMGNNFALITIIALLISFVVNFLYFRRDYVKQSDYLKKNPLHLLWIFLIGLLMSHALSILLSLLPLDNLLGSYQTVENELFGASWILVVIRAVIVTPVVEELVFRGLVFRRMKEYTSFWPAAIVSSVLFGLYHMNLIQGIYAFLFGIIICLLYDRYGHLAAAVLVHFGANLLSVILQYANVSYPALWVYIVVMVAAIIASVAIYRFLIKKREDN